MESPVYDATVLGGGIIGRSIALKLIKAKPEFKVLLIDQFSMSESQGSSKGRSKGIQKTHWVKETDTMRQMRIDSLQEWESLQMTVCPKTIMRKHEALFVGPADCPFMMYTLDSLQKYPGFDGMGYMSNASLREQYPNIHFSDDCVGLLDASELCLAADTILEHILEEFENLGGTTKKGQVTEITPGDTINISTKEKVYQTKKIVIATGPWSGPMMQEYGIDISLKRKHAMEMYWKLKKPYIPCPSLFEYKNKSMVWTNYTTEHGPCLKIGFPGEIITHEDLHDVNKLHDKKMVIAMTKYIEDTFGEMVSTIKPTQIENCVYTFTKDGKFILGRHPEKNNIFFAVGMSGRGFGYSPAISNIVCDLVLDRQPKYDISEFDVARFK
ncbi:peroxisomal sarcosine oxidase-like [Mytilus trossulus]|uniref:peroxisomal sarcosine oxidase-like n=1 Tax=Mytilus trossulus TaxID=6551 RepID=UPI00300716C1